MTPSQLSLVLYPVGVLCYDRDIILLCLYKQDFELPCGGESIPASSLVLYPVGVLCYDRDIWGAKPQEFRPRRFQDDPQLEEVMRKLLPIPKVGLVWLG